MRIQTLFLCFLLIFSVTQAQVPEDRGLPGLIQVLDRLDVVGSVLHTGAHPDDENSSLLAWLSRGQGVRTAYLSATRGDGGQNLIGTELYEGIGVLRTEELLAARRFDRAQQFFTPNYEFGFTKTADEAFEKWGREKLIGDVVRVIRQFRPEIIVSRFSGTPRDGHGHHQAMGIATREAFRAAADPNRFPEFGKPWQAKKLYINALGSEQGRLRINVGEFSQALGRSYHEMAMEGRSLHRSQSQGASREKGPRYTELQLAEKTVGVADDEPLFSGTIHKLTDIARLAPALSNDLNILQQRINAIRDGVTLRRPGDILPELVDAIKLLKQTQGKADDTHVQFLLRQKEADFHEAARLAAGLVMDVLVSDDPVVPGQELTMTIAVINGGPYDFGTVRTNTEFPPGWNVTYEGSSGMLTPGSRFEQKFKVKVADDAAFTQPYWLRQPRQGDRFIWPDGSSATLPFDPPLLLTQAEIAFGETNISLTQPAEFRRVDNIYGEQRSLLKVVPALSVRSSPDIAIVPISGDRQKVFTVTIENQNPLPIGANVRLTVPEGWSVSPPSKAVEFSREGEKASVQFVVTVRQAAGDFKVGAVAEAQNKRYTMGYDAVAYSHIETQHIYAPTESRVKVFDVRTSVRKVGYVDGAGDRVAEALEQMGMEVTRLNSNDLASGDLSRYETIVLGIRSYAARDDLRAYNARLLDYVAQGGTLIVQYNTYEILDGSFGPYPFAIRRPHDRVTREEAPVTILDPAHPVFNTPNKITPQDFEGWVQERGLYFLGTWDPRYTPLMESNDPGESPQKGGLVVANYGKGIYVYTGYAFFRQLPSGVPGAYRLFANLVSLRN